VSARTAPKKRPGRMAPAFAQKMIATQFAYFTLQP
jgi:hypothetical protein